MALVSAKSGYIQTALKNKLTGAGVFSNDLNIKISTTLDKLKIIFQAECVGIIKAAQADAARDVKNPQIIIVTDSASVLQALKTTR